MKEKICPIGRWIGLWGESRGLTPCLKMECAWFDTRYHDCAVLEIARNIER